MRAVTTSDLHSLQEADTTQVMMMDMTNIGPAFVDMLVRDSPLNVLSKKGKYLPLEIWLEILRHAVDSQQPTPGHKYTLAMLEGIPQKHSRKVEGGEEDTGKIRRRRTADVTTTFSCVPLQNRRPCFVLGCEDDVELYNDYLSHPSRHICRKRARRPTCLCHFDDRVKEDLPTIARLPASFFARTEIPVFYVNVAVSDVVAFVEGGLCCMCGGGRQYCTACREGRNPNDNHGSSRLCSHMDTRRGLHVACLLCLGPFWFERSLEAFDQPDLRLSSLSPEEQETETISFFADVNKHTAYLGYASLGEFTRSPIHDLPW